MADHIQDQILDYYRQLLAAGGTDAGDRVEIERVDLVGMDELPHMHLEAEAETRGGSGPAEQGTIGFPQVTARFFGWTLTLTVSQAADYGKAGRTLGLQAEKLICGSWAANSAGGIARNGTRLQSVEFRKAGTSEQPVFVVEQHWVSGYVCRDNAPDAPL